MAKKLYYKIKVQTEAEALKKVIGDLAEMITAQMKYEKNRKEIDAVLEKGFEKKSDTLTEVLESRRLGETGYQFKWAELKGGAYELTIRIWKPFPLDALRKDLDQKLKRYFKEKRIEHKIIKSTIDSV